VGPRANLAVSGVLITLYVQQRASGALAVTFALTANRLLSWLTYPVVGRLSDRTKSRVGRRTPYMAGSLIIMGISTWMFTVVSGYWLLVLFIVIARQAAAIFTLTNVAVVPEVFGRSRWIKALLLTTVLGTVASLAIKGTVIATWNQKDPSTWNLPFEVAAVIMVAVGVLVLVLVREAPNASFGAATDRSDRARPTRDELRDILSGPNAKVLVAGSLLFWAGIGSTAYVAILFFQKVLHAGASAQTIAGLATGLPVFLIGIALGVPLSRKLTPMQLAIGAPLIGAVLAGVQYFDTHIWQAVVLSYIGAPFIGAYIIVMAPLLLQLLPRAGGLGERLGVLLSPFNLCSVLLAYIAAVTVDATGNYRLIWLFPAATGLGHAIVNCWLKYPAKRASSPDMIGRLWEWSVVQAEAMAESGIVTGLLAAPLLGVVTKEDADSAVVIDMARNILGNPYDPEPEVGDDRALGPETDEVGQSPAGGDLGVTGVRQVGGGPVVDRSIGDQKSGRGDSLSTEGPAGRSGAGMTPSTTGSTTGAGGSTQRGGSDGGGSVAGTAPSSVPELVAKAGTPYGGVASPASDDSADSADSAGVSDSGASTDSVGTGAASRGSGSDAGSRAGEIADEFEAPADSDSDSKSDSDPDPDSDTGTGSEAG
jgi:Na+/melibiose symporter-like transporter